MAVGIFGGSFNPIHVGHVQLGDELVAQGLVDELWYVVSPQNPFKAADHLMPDEARLRMVQLALEGHSRLRVCDVEMHLPRPSYMADTMHCLRTQHPGVEFVLVIGADNWERFDRWRRYEELLSHHRLIVYPRPGHTLTQLPEGVTLASTSLIDISGTRIRTSLANPHYDGEGLDPKVWAYLKQHTTNQQTKQEEDEDTSRLRL